MCWEGFRHALRELSEAEQNQPRVIADRWRKFGAVSSSCFVACAVSTQSEAAEVSLHTYAVACVLLADEARLGTAEWLVSLGGMLVNCLGMGICEDADKRVRNSALFCFLRLLSQAGRPYPLHARVVSLRVLEAARLLYAHRLDMSYGLVISALDPVRGEIERQEGLRLPAEGRGDLLANWHAYLRGFDDFEAPTLRAALESIPRRTVPGVAAPENTPTHRWCWSQLPDDVVWVTARLVNTLNAETRVVLAARSRTDLVATQIISVERAVVASQVVDLDRALRAAWLTYRRPGGPTTARLATGYALGLSRWLSYLNRLFSDFLARLELENSHLVVQASGPLVAAPWDLLSWRGGRPLGLVANTISRALSRDSFLLQLERRSPPRSDGGVACAAHLSGEGGEAQSPGVHRLLQRCRSLAKERGLPLRVAGVEPPATGEWLQGCLRDPMTRYVGILAHGGPGGVALQNGVYRLPSDDLQHVEALLFGSCFVGRAAAGIVRVEDQENVVYGLSEAQGLVALLLGAGVQSLYAHSTVVPDLVAADVIADLLGALADSRDDDEPFRLARARSKLLREALGGSTPNRRGFPEAEDPLDTLRICVLAASSVYGV